MFDGAVSRQATVADKIQIRVCRARSNVLIERSVPNQPVEHLGCVADERCQHAGEVFGNGIAEKIERKFSRQRNGFENSRQSLFGTEIPQQEQREEMRVALRHVA